MAKQETRRNPVQPQIGFTVQAWKEGPSFVAYSPDLDVSSCGNSLREAKERLREAVGLFLEEAARMGTLPEILSEAGFEKRGDTYQPRKLLEQEKIRLAIPVATS